MKGEHLRQDQGSEASDRKHPTETDQAGLECLEQRVDEHCQKSKTAFSSAYHTICFESLLSFFNTTQ